VDDSLAHFIDTHVRGAECSVCAGTEWSFLSFGAAENPRVDVIGVCCANCGYMRFHAAEVVGPRGT
jgi:hypothetical protein